MKNVRKLRVKDVEEIRPRLAFIKDPTKRLQLMFKYNLKEDALTELNTLINKGIYFEDRSRAEGVQLDGRKYGRQSGGEPIVSSMDSTVHFTLSGIAKFFGWTKKQLTDFTVRLFEATMEKIDPASGWREIATWAGSWEITATEKAYEMYRPKNKKFCTRFERWLLLCHFYDGDHFFHYLGNEWYEKWIGWTKPAINHMNHDENGALEERADIETSKLNAFAKRLEATGMDELELRNVFTVWLEKYTERGLDYYFHGIVVNANAFYGENRRKTIAFSKMTDIVLKQFFDGSMHHYTFASLAKRGMKSDPTFRQKYTDRLAYVLSKGNAGWADGINNIVGEMLFGKETIELESVAPLAFDKAVAAGDFGVAAALVLQFGEENCFDEKILRASLPSKNTLERKQMFAQLVEDRKTQICESFNIAKTAGQPIRLSYHCSFLKPY